MKKTNICIIIMFISAYAFSQNQADQKSIEQEVNTQVWKPFKQAIAQRDSKKFNELHTDDILRISKSITIGAAYKESNRKHYALKSSTKQIIDFRFEQRVYAGNIGYEVGYYSVKISRQNGEKREAYSRFHIVLKKVEGRWKIAQDWDAPNINGVEITAADFEKLPPVNLQ
jgi:ketosteroid isomerase-like protein